MEYRFGSLGDYLTVTKGSTGIGPEPVRTLNIQRPTLNIEGAVFATARVRGDEEIGASEDSKWVRLVMFVLPRRLTTDLHG